MVNSDLCWMKDEQKRDSEFDHGGYFLIEGAEKIFIVQEQICLRRLWVSNIQGWTVAYRSEVKRNKLIIRLVENSKPEELKSKEKVLNYLCGFYSGVSSAKEIVDLVDYGKDDPIVNLICHFRVDTLTHQLHYPQKPLFRTMTADCLGTPGYLSSHTGILPKPEFYNGQNAIVAVNVHLGCNQEDSLVMNRASLERGMFRSEPIRSYKAEVDNKESSEKRRNSDDVINFGKNSKVKLDDNGFPYIGANLQSGNIVIGGCAESGADHSIKLKHTVKGMVQKVMLSFGLLVLGVSREFPLHHPGIVPDIVINSCFFPSRQTSGQLLEAALGKGIASGGCLKSATPFSTPSVDAITDRLHSLSDSSQMHVSQKCKNAASVIQQSVASGHKIRGPYCRVCESIDDVVRVNVPYGAKLLCQELFSMVIEFETQLC
ncbi:DNA-directed RNA polymerase D subunit 2b, partial [Cucurbita argyrosperma subsp. argyrosperma]